MSDIVKEGTVLVFEDDEMSGDRQVVRVFIVQKDFAEDGYMQCFASRSGELDAPLLIRDGLIKEAKFRDSIMSWDDLKMIENKPTPATKEPKSLTPKTLRNTDSDTVTKNVSDLVKWGDPSMFKLLCKASSESEGWMKSTKAMETPAGCLVQVTTQQRNPDGSYSVAEALTFAPETKIFEHVNEAGDVAERFLVQL